jgi:hypothetical protein
MCIGAFFCVFISSNILHMSQVHESRTYSVSILSFFFMAMVVSKSSVFLALAILLSSVSPPGNCGMSQCWTA